MQESALTCLHKSRIIVLGTWRADGAILDANDALLQLLLCQREDIQAGRIRWPDITPAEYEPLDARAIQELGHRGECTPFEKEYLRSDGSRVRVLVGAA